MNFVKTLLLGFVFLLSGCNTTGGTIAGLVPAPKLLKGEIKDGTYLAVDGSFKVNVPFPENTPAYTYMEVKEQYANIGSYVSFHSSVYPNEVYRIEIGRKLESTQLSLPFKEMVDGLLEGYKKQLTNYGTESVEKWRSETKLDGKRAMLITLEQMIPSRSSYQGRSHDFVMSHIIYVVESPNGNGGVVWAQWPHECRSCSSGPESEIISTSDRIKLFIESFRLNI